MVRAHVPLAGWISTIALAAIVGAPRTAAAQAWPEGAAVIGVGLSALDGRGGASITAGVTRSWGPIVGGLLGDMRIVEDRPNGLYSVDLLNGQIRCGNRVINVGSNCPTTLSGVGGVMAEVGVSLSPSLPVLIVRGYRMGPVDEGYWAVMLHGETRHEGLRWLARASAGPHMAQILVGAVVSLAELRP